MLMDEITVNIQDDESVAVSLDDQETLSVSTYSEVVYAHNYNNLINQPSVDDVTLVGNKTPVEIGCVPFRLAQLNAIETPTKSVRSSANMFVNNGSNGYKMTLQQVKSMGTKVLVADNLQDSRVSDLDIDDFIITL